MACARRAVVFAYSCEQRSRSTRFGVRQPCCQRAAAWLPHSKGSIYLPSAIVCHLLGSWYRGTRQLFDEAHPARPAAVGKCLAILVGDQHNALIVFMA